MQHTVCCIQCIVTKEQLCGHTGRAFTELVEVNDEGTKQNNK